MPYEVIFRLVEVCRYKSNRIFLANIRQIFGLVLNIRSRSFNFFC